MKPVLTDEEIKEQIAIARAHGFPESFGQPMTIDEIESACRSIERLTRERMMELVCSRCGEGANHPNHGGNGKSCVTLFGLSGYVARITRAEYLHRE